jgi:hypothetical protein
MAGLIWIREKRDNKQYHRAPRGNPQLAAIFLRHNNGLYRRNDVVQAPNEVGPPASIAAVTSTFWTVHDLVEMIGT